MLLPIPGRQGLHHFDLRHAEKTELYETDRSEKRRKAEELSFLFSPDIPVTLRVP